MVRGFLGEYVLTPSDVVRVTAVRVGEVTLRFIVESNLDDYEAFVRIADDVLASIAFD